MDELSAKRTLGTTLEEAPNDLDDAAHRLQDELVLDFFCSLTEPSTPLAATLLLPVIVSFSEGKLDPKFKKISEVKALLQDHPELMEKLEDAWKARTFRDIRNLSALSCFENQL